MTTNLFDFARYTTVTDIQAVIDDPVKPCAGAMVCGWTGYQDDYKFNEHRKILVNARSKLYGGFMWGAYMELGYGTGSKPGAGQVDNFWSLITSGGIEWNLPPWLALEGFSDDPKIPLTSYMDNKVIPAIKRLSDYAGKLPVIYTGPNWAWWYLRPARQIAKYDLLFQCPLALARYNTFPDPAGVADPLIGVNYNLHEMWDTWAYWQYYGDYKKAEGVSDLDWVLWPGDRASLEAWSKDYMAGIPPWSQPALDIWATVQGDHLNLRHEPGLSGDKIGVMNRGSSWKVLESREMDDYLWVRLDSGWVATGQPGSGLAVLDER